MRSRYTAFARGDVDHLLRTWHPSTRPTTLTLDPAIRWTQLEVLDRVGGGLFDTDGVVEFRAHHREGQQQRGPARTQPFRPGGRAVVLPGRDRPLSPGGGEPATSDAEPSACGRRQVTAAVTGRAPTSGLRRDDQGVRRGDGFSDATAAAGARRPG